MARPNLQSPDGRHIQFGENDTTTMPDGFTAPDTGATCPGWFGRIMDNDDGGGFGAASIDQDYFEASESTAEDD
jgi:hypothetical protein